MFVCALTSRSGTEGLVELVVLLLGHAESLGKAADGSWDSNSCCRGGREAGGDAQHLGLGRGSSGGRDGGPQRSASHGIPIMQRAKPFR